MIRELVQRLIKARRRKQYAKTYVPKTHDYTKTGWGHNYVLHRQADGKANISGWGYGLNELDYLILKNPRGKPVRYQIQEIEYKWDPRDMWNADVKYVGE